MFFIPKFWVSLFFSFVLSPFLFLLFPLFVHLSPSSFSFSVLLSRLSSSSFSLFTFQASVPPSPPFLPFLCMTVPPLFVSTSFSTPHCSFPFFLSSAKFHLSLVSLPSGLSPFTFSLRSQSLLFLSSSFYSLALFSLLSPLPNSVHSKRETRNDTQQPQWGWEGNQNGVN